MAPSRAVPTPVHPHLVVLALVPVAATLVARAAAPDRPTDRVPPRAATPLVAPAQPVAPAMQDLLLSRDPAQKLASVAGQSKTVKSFFLRVRPLLLALTAITTFTCIAELFVLAAPVSPELSPVSP